MMASIAQRNLLAILVPLVLLGLLGAVSPAWIGPRPPSPPMRQGALAVTAEPFERSPFICDGIVDAVGQTLLLTPEEAAAWTGDRFRAWQFFVPGPARIEVIAELATTDDAPFLSLYDTAALPVQPDLQSQPGVWGYSLESAGIYRLQLVRHEGVVRSVRLRVTDLKTETPFDQYLLAHMKRIELRFVGRQAARLRELEAERAASFRRFESDLRWQQHPSPDERVVARIRAGDGPWALAAVARAARNAAHESVNGVTSMDVRLLSRNLP
jgi:hypothetical protein